MKTATYRLEEKEEAALAAIAFIEERTVSSLVRQAVAEFIRRRLADQELKTKATERLALHQQNIDGLLSFVGPDDPFQNGHEPSGQD